MRAFVNALPIIAIGFWLLAVSSPILAAEFTPEELALLPPWCRLESGFVWAHPSVINDPKIRTQVVALNGAGCNGHHHYCWALVSTNHVLLAEGKNLGSMGQIVANAEGDFTYMLQRSKPTCPLVYDAYVKLGEVYAMFGNYSNAEKNFQEAVKNNINKSAAYVGLSDLYEAQGNSEKAVSVLNEGIKANPRSPALQKKLSRLNARISGAPSDR
jgi:tetratricopeptide (TPR) repeat protein